MSWTLHDTREVLRRDEKPPFLSLLVRLVVSDVASDKTCRRTENVLFKDLDKHDDIFFGTPIERRWKCDCRLIWGLIRVDDRVCNWMQVTHPCWLWHLASWSFKETSISSSIKNRRLSWCLKSLSVVLSSVILFTLRVSLRQSLWTLSSCLISSAVKSCGGKSKRKVVVDRNAWLTTCQTTGKKLSLKYHAVDDDVVVVRNCWSTPSRMIKTYV